MPWILRTGKVIRQFGENGSVDLGTGLNTPGVLYKDTLILGGKGGKGSVRALDVRTGEQRWIFHLIPRPGEVGYDTWPKDPYKTATGAMPWCGQSLDEERAGSSMSPPRRPNPISTVANATE